MREFINKHFDEARLPHTLAVIAIINIFILGFIVYFLAQKTSNDIEALDNNVTATTEKLSQKLEILEAALATTTLTGAELAQRLQEQQSQNEDIQSNLEDISGTVGTLEKLSKTDKELLQKYSKVYFLSDNYVPMSLDTIDERYLSDPNKELKFHASALSFLERMVRRASNDDITLKIASAYRSFGEQSSLKDAYLVSYGTGANRFSADQGYSEHQLGTTVDIATDSVDTKLVIKFETTPAFKWLTENAYRYGFVLSYPKGNIYYQYEPWHWRFVGVELATELHDLGINFSDMEQREIDKYLVNIFD
ncbi:MAG: D-alanyl-D-alanine carboxypeptidase family protein [Minisyncoccia bacterium]